jgi:hypothetical protein
VLETVHAYTELGKPRNSLLRRWIQIELLGRFRQKFTRWPRELQERYVQQARGLLADLVPPAAVATLPPIDRVRDRLIREGAVDKLVILAKLEAGQQRGTVELTDGPGRSRITAVVRTGVSLPNDRADIQVVLTCRRCGDGFTLSAPVGVSEDPDRPLDVRVPLDLRMVVGSRPASGRLEFSLLLRVDEQEQELPLPVRKAAGGAGIRKVWIAAGRPVMTRVGADRGGGIQVTSGGVREIAAALRRKIERRLRIAKPT